MKSKPKLKTCKAKGCRNKFVPSRPFEDWCSFDCAVKLSQERQEAARKRKEAKDRREVKEKLNALKSLSKLANEAQVFVNRYARLRDYHKGCCSCDKPATWDGQWHGSHYISAHASSALRFHLWNINKACSQCNKDNSGNIREYGLRMDQKRKEFLDNHPRNRRFQREYLIRMKTVFARRCRIMERRLGLK